MPFYKNNTMEESLIMMKKLLTAMLTLSIAFTPVGSFVFDGTDNVASAKSYKSGKRSFNPAPSSPAQNNKSNSFTRKSTNNNSTFNRNGGLMRGILYGGIAGMLLGGLLGNMGVLGGFIGLLINVLAVVVIISLARSIFRMLKNKRREQDDNSWRR